nr:thiamine pyrophosphate-binding protein [Nakamurella flava]
MIAPAPFTVADHLLQRLAELGADTVFGVPGDYSLGLLDHIVAHPSVDWVGTTNELNAGYAADAYARLRGIGALCTTFGVGELSAVNAITGSYAEFVPVVHIVGAPRSTVQAAHRIVHHTLGDGQFDHFLGMHADITCARAALTADNAAGEIDRVLTAVRDHRLPGYLLLPADVAEAPVPRPATALPPRSSVTDPEALAAFASAAARLIQRGAATGRGPDASVLVGLLCHRLGAAGRLTDLLAAAPLPHATTLWAKSLVDESDPLFVGTYSGAASDPATRAVVEDAGTVILAGVQFTDLTSGLFTQHITRSRTIEIGAREASVGEARFGPIELPDALAALGPVVAELDDRPRDPRSRRDRKPAPPAPADPPVTPADHTDHTALSQVALWDTVTAFLRPGDIVLADQGTSFYGMGLHRLPTGVTFIGQPLWASIGYTLPGLLGVGIAEPDRRGVLLVGDGAAQMTATEIGTVLRHCPRAVIVVVDNDGYTVERAIHGPEQPYNDIAAWDWTCAPAFFGAPATATRVTTVGELRTALQQAQQADRPTIVQAVVPALDVPPLLDTLARSLGKK